MDNPIVKVQQGELRGIYEKNVNDKSFIAFRGIPYAKPPVGNLRFKDPEDVESWCGVRDATKFSDRCAQQDWFTRTIVGSDDCLYLNVYTSNINLQMPKAVMVWIHGGAFIFGSGEDDMYGPDYLIEKDIVLVTINYRLGVLGFLNVDDEVAPGNQGLKDQVQALKWIQKNINVFGGDSNNVTIFGESAGGASVHYLTISPLSHGLFHKAIIQSGVAINPWASSINSPMVMVKKLADILNKNISNIKEFVYYLQTLDAHHLIEATAKIQTHKDKILTIHPFIPSIDSKAKNPFMPISLDDASKSGIKVPCICGYVSHEGMIIIAGMNNEIYDEIDGDPKNLLVHPTALRHLMNYNITVDDIKQYYFHNGKISSVNIENIVDALSTIYFTLGIHNVIEIQQKLPNVPLYLYKFQYEVENSLLKKFLNVNMKGTCHGEEMSFLFYQKFNKLLDKQLPKFDSIEYNITQRFIELWTNFAKTGNPTPKTNKLIPIEWLPVDNSNEYNCLYITEKLDMTTEINITQQLCKSIKNKL